MADRLLHSIEGANQHSDSFMAELCIFESLTACFHTFTVEQMIEQKV